ncbi:hypothetical protein EIP86_000218 [Pleurotus ostreatoroseus]|nr:hypothetical protein EIP86_000218 [Pleurotus ostreatoroseus]
MSSAKRDEQEKAADDVKGKAKETREVHRLMAEKKMALELLEGYSIALKHHLRGEPGIYFEDLYALVKPLHHHAPKRPSEPIAPLVAEPESVISGRESLEDLLSETPTNPVIPPINGYGGGSSRVRAGRGHHDSLLTLSSDSTLPDERRPLLPSADMPHNGLWSGISGDLIPFSGIIGNVVKWFSHKDKKAGDEERGIAIRDRERDQERQRWTHFKHRPKIAGGGDNVPLQVIRCLSCWLSVLEERGTVPDLDMFCNEVIRNDLEHLKHTPCRNAFLISRHEGEEPIAEEFDPIGEHGRIEEVFGYHERQES